MMQRLIFPLLSRFKKKVRKVLLGSMFLDPSWKLQNCLLSHGKYGNCRSSLRDTSFILPGVSLLFAFV